MTRPHRELGSDSPPRAAEVEPPAIPVFHAGGSATSTDSMGEAGLAIAVQGEIDRLRGADTAWAVGIRQRLTAALHPARQPRTGRGEMSGAAQTQASVLDACCGSRMFWFDKNDDRVMFVDKRRESLIDRDGRRVVVDPDVLGNYADLPFDDNSFSLVVFDPPHTYNGAGSEMAKKYGRLEPGWREEITAGSAECFRVLRPGGTLIFKWNEHRVPLAKILAMTPEKPLFGHRSGAAAKTHWVAFIKAALLPVDSPALGPSR